MEYRRPLPTDFEKMVALQSANLVSNLSQTEQADGFLTAVFSAQQFEVLDHDLCVTVCAEEEKMVGYACASSVEYNKTVPLLKGMLEQFPQIIYKNKQLAAYQTFVYGPVCIDKEYRGKSILVTLFDQMLAFSLQAQPQLELLTVPISSENKRSLHAHQKLGMEIVSEFEFNGKLFCTLVLPMRDR